MDKRKVMPFLSTGLSRTAARRKKGFGSSAATVDQASDARSPAERFCTLTPVFCFSRPSSGRQRCLRRQKTGNTAFNQRPPPKISGLIPAQEKGWTRVFLLGIFNSIAVVVEPAFFCEQVAFFLEGQAFTRPQSMWAAGSLGRGRR